MENKLNEFRVKGNICNLSKNAKGDIKASVSIFYSDKSGKKKVDFVSFFIPLGLDIYAYNKKNKSRYKSNLEIGDLVDVYGELRTYKDKNGYTQMYASCQSIFILHKAESEVF